MKKEHDVAVAGAGILGLAHAYHLARRGLRVIVFERHPRAQGASVRNFGMIWPVGQPPGPLNRLAQRSRDYWLSILHASGLWYARSGSLHLAYHDDEAQVLGEFIGKLTPLDSPCVLLSAREVVERFPAIRPEGLRGGMWSPLEVTVDPRQVVAELPAWLERTHGVEFVWDTPVLRYDSPQVVTVRGTWTARRLVICTGTDFRELAPEAFTDSGLVACKLQMMRSQAYGERFRLGTMLAAGLTLGHYRAFADCPTLPAVRRRHAAELPEYGRFGIHVLAAQNGRGEVVIGDSHEYGEAIESFDNPHIDDLILNYLRTFVTIPDLTIAARWHGVYVKHPSEPYVVVRPAPATVAVTGVGGAGMTLSFGLAEQVVADWLGEEHDRAGGL
jgi:FAD dependent oxidoreductase TIGR03364